MVLMLHAYKRAVQLMELAEQIVPEFASLPAAQSLSANPSPRQRHIIKPLRDFLSAHSARAVFGSYLITESFGDL